MRKLIRLWSVMALITATQVALASAPVIQPGAVWLDDRGLPIQAHGGGMLHWNEAYFWFGEDRSITNDPFTKVRGLLRIEGPGALAVSPPSSGH